MNAIRRWTFVVIAVVTLFVLVILFSPMFGLMIPGTLGGSGVIPSTIGLVWITVIIILLGVIFLIIGKRLR